MLNTIGSDMELFGMNKDGHHVALCGRIGGSKEAPLQIPEFQRGFMIQEDNVSLEFNIPVCHSIEEFVLSFSKMRNKTKEILVKLGLEQSLNSSMSFDKSELVHPNSLIFGCEPDYNAWTMTENQKPFSKDETLRTCGGHIHVGTELPMIDGVKNMDLFLGVPSVILDSSPSSIKRRELYGKAGAMRPKPYGFEYRVLSNYWMFSDKLVSWVYEQTFRSCFGTLHLTPAEEGRIQMCINTGDKDLAKDLIKSYDITLPK